ncbi:thiamine pyrophosphate-binding protein [Enterococcus sp.]|uniref:thiamine pyrophosphate-binding protein n=1 Tax=Enterococcus sp. TaxID=35783 RepID=UPI00289ED886|nr:thiamine pyrophosphate-binding protein [Enterococcus sp.]
MKLKEYLLNELKLKNVKRIFGVPGRENEEIQFNEIEGINFITTRVEFTAAVAGDVSGRITNNLQVVFSTMGPGATNLTTGIASAMLNKSPVLYLTSQLESNDIYYNITHQCVNQKRIFDPITKYSVELESPEQIVCELDKAYKIAMEEPRGPVHISIPTDFFNRELLDQYLSDTYCEVINDEKGKKTETPDYLKKIENMQNMLIKSKKPVCLLGSEICRSEAFDETLTFCKSWNIPFITSANVKGISSMFEDDLNLGSASCYMEGILRYPALDKIFNESDLILLIGYQYVDDLLPKMWNRGIEKKTVLINMNSNNQLQAIIEPNLYLNGSLPVLLNKLKNEKENEKKEFRDFSDLKKVLKYQNCQNYRDKINPYQVMNVLNKFMEDSILVTDIGYYRHHAIIFTDSKIPFSFISDTGISSFGSGLPAAIAAKINFPDKKVFLVCGDGGFHSVSGDLATLIKYNLPIIIVLLNNSQFKLIDLYQKKKVKSEKQNKEITKLSSVNFKFLAKANGCYGESANSISELETIISNWNGTKPILIELPLEYTDEFQISF